MPFCSELIRFADKRTLEASGSVKTIRNRNQQVLVSIVKKLAMRLERYGRKVTDYRVVTAQGMDEREGVSRPVVAPYWPD